MNVTRQHIHQSNLIEDIDDDRADNDSWCAWQFLSQQPIVTCGVILAVHATITAHQNDDLLPGWRSCRVWVGSREGADPATVRGLINGWALNCHAKAPWSPQEAHVAFENIHPFRDGNGRTGRMLMWWHEIVTNSEPSLLRASRRQDYYEWFRQ